MEINELARDRIHEKLTENIGELKNVNIIFKPQKSTKGSWRDSSRSVNYKDIFWWSCELIPELSNSFFGYTHVHLMPYCITGKIKEEAQANRKEIPKKRPDIDVKSGNIHPSVEYVGQSVEKEKILQIVLVSKPKDSAFGPVKPENCSSELTVLSDKVWLPKVPSACFYPPIEDIDDPTDADKKIRDLLKKIWVKLKNLEIAEE